MNKDKKTIQALTEIIDGKLLAIASDDSVDRMGDSLEIDKWDLKNFRKNPVLLAGHQNFPEFVIGVTKNLRVEGNKLLFEPVFHGITELARNMRDMFEEKVLTAWSVGFIPNALINPEDKGAKNELLEISAVAVAANVNALTSAKAYSDDVKNEVKEWVGKENEEVKTKKEDKAQIEQQTGETNEHFHTAIVDEDTGDGKTSVTADHDHEVKEFKVQETEGHTHSLSKPKKKEMEVEKKDVGEIVALADVIGHLDFLIFAFKDNGVNEKTTNKMKEALTILMDVIKLQTTIGKKEFMLKEGKIISKKNRDKISSAVEQTKQTVTALEELLTLSETPKEKTKEVTEKITVEKTKPVSKMPHSEKEMAVQILKKIAGNSNLALKKLKEK